MRLDPAADQRLVERCLAGDPHAWQQLVRRHERLVYAVGRSYRLEPEDLGDLFQDVFAALLKGLPRLREPRALVRWLSSTSERIARATALRRRRDAARTAASPDAVNQLPAAPDLEGDAAGIERLEEQAMVRLALSALPGRCRELLAMLYYEDPAPSYAEVSKRIGVPIGSLGPTRGRCFERLRRELAVADDETGGISTSVERTSETGTRSSRSRPAGPVPNARGRRRTLEEDGT